LHSLKKKVNGQTVEDKKRGVMIACDSWVVDGERGKEGMVRSLEKEREMKKAPRGY